MADPILKWAGGKRQLLDEIYARFPDEFRIKIEETQKKDEQEKITEKHPNGKVNFHEPFVGGGAVIFDLEPKWGTLNDTNSRLINFYTQVKTNPQKIIEISETFRSPKDSPDKSRRFHTKNRKGKPIKNFYYQQREIFNNRPYGDEFDPVEEAAILLYLNRTCYNGLYRENSKGGFNTPIGSYKNPDWRRKEQILALHEVLNQIKIYNRDFDYVLEIASPGDLIYFDPPYRPISKTSNFTSYSKHVFADQDQKGHQCEQADGQDQGQVLQQAFLDSCLYPGRQMRVKEKGQPKEDRRHGENTGY